MKNPWKTFWHRLWCKHDWRFTRAYQVLGTDNYYDHFPEIGEKINMVVHEHTCRKCGKTKEI